MMDATREIGLALDMLEQAGAMVRAYEGLSMAGRDRPAYRAILVARSATAIAQGAVDRLARAEGWGGSDGD